MKRGRESLFSIYWFSIVVTLVLMATIGFGMGTGALIIVLMLSLLEVTFSFDNAVVNASVLARMSVFWQRMFMTVGIFIAVFGMRLVLPIVLVAVSTQLGIGDVINLALHNPSVYAENLRAAHPTIAAFGGTFLLMIFLDFLINQDWLSRHMSKREARLFAFAPALAAVGVLGLVYGTASPVHRPAVLIAGLVGIGTYVVVHTLSNLFAKPTNNKGAVQSGFFTFLYLELLDASFSFDGVVGAFAITNNVLLIAAGLGAGAVWVRSMTIHIVRRGILAKYVYLDVGAHMAILALSATLLLGISLDLPGLLTGFAGIGIIAASFVASVLHNRIRRR